MSGIVFIGVGIYMVLMIVVGVALDFAQQVESQLITRHYEGLTGSKGSRIRARNA